MDDGRIRIRNSNGSESGGPKNVRIRIRNTGYLSRYGLEPIFSAMESPHWFEPSLSGVALKENTVSWSVRRTVLFVRSIMHRKLSQKLSQYLYEYLQIISWWNVLIGEWLGGFTKLPYKAESGKITLGRKHLWLPGCIVVIPDQNSCESTLFLLAESGSGIAFPKLASDQDKKKQIRIRDRIRLCLA